MNHVLPMNLAEDFLLLLLLLLSIEERRVRVRLRVRVRQTRGSWSQCTDARPRGAFHEPAVWSPGFSRSGPACAGPSAGRPPEGGTPYRWHDPDGFMVPMHAKSASDLSALSVRRGTASGPRSRCMRKTKGGFP